MMSTMDFHSQVASILEVLANAAVAEICKLVDDGYAVVQLEMTQSQKDNECLRRKIKLLELQVARYRAERLRGADGSVHSRFPGVRVTHRQNRDPLNGSLLHGKTRFLNRARQTVQKPVAILLDQDPDQEVVTTTKIESPDAQEEQELCIVKVEGVSSNSEPPLASGPSGITEASASVEVSGSDPLTFLDRTPKTEDVIVIDEEPSSDKEPRDGGSSGHNRSAVPGSSKSDSGGENHQQTDGAKLWSVAPPDATVSTHQDSSATACSSSIFSDANLQSQRSRCPVTSPEQNLSGFHPALYQVVEKTFSCPTCGKRFPRAADLQKHMTRHYREKPHTCVVCGKSFVCQSQLDMHHNVHTGERPFSCTVCGRRFSHRSNLMRHFKIQHSAQGYHGNSK